jgi:hypothetical protein
MENNLLSAENQHTEEGRSLADRLWPDKSISEPWKQNPHWSELPLPYRLWPDETWPPKQLPRMPHSSAVQYEYDRLFSEYYQREKDYWD